MSTAFAPFDPLAVEFAGQQLIEASAGTGKTFTIAELYLRLVLEQGYRVDQILVVTFTNAATAELADRIRRRLAQGRRQLDVACRDEIDDPFVRELVGGSDALEPLRRRLDNALRGFDEAAVFTIHGFCQRVLADRAFASGMAFETELEADSSERLAEIVDDFWRLNFYQASPLLIDWLLGEKYTPEKLLRDIRPHLGKPYLALRRAGEPAEQARIQADFTAAYERTRAVWRAQRAEVVDLLRAALDADALHRNQYKADQLDDWCARLDDYLDAGRPNPVLCDKFEQFTAGKLAKATKKNAATPQHPLFDRCQRLLDARAELAAAFEDRLHNLRAELLDYGNRELATRKRRDQVQSYDDLLLNLDRALDSDQGPALANGIRKRYRAALIDEFQDTDPTQYRIFRRIYDGSDCPLFLVGDPKQAIYSFRGADIFAYLDAHADARRRLTLEYNWRSTPALISAVNTLFRRHETPFLLEDIDFHPVRPAAKPDRRTLDIDGDNGAPFLLWFLHDPQSKTGVIKVDAARDQIAAASAAEIARLLNLADRGRARLGDRSLQGGDIAVLVRSHAEGALIRRTLMRLGIPSVQRSRDNVFDTVEAEELERVLRAVLEPARDDLVRAALASELLGYDAAAILACETDEQHWETLIEGLQRLAERWRRRGFAAMFRLLLGEWSVSQRLLGFDDGERRLTNLLHLGELLQTTAVRERLMPEPLVAWLAGRRRLHSDEADEQQLRLESDEQLVQIVTVHKSKGLEYPIVFCPFGWSSGRDVGKDEAVRFHDPDQDYRAVLDFGSEQHARARELARYEKLAEDLRLLYVALTRAEQRCYLGWGKINTAENAALAWLLHRPSVATPGTDRREAAVTFYKSLDADGVWGELESLVAAAGGTIALSEAPDGAGQRYRPVTPADSPFVARSFDGPVRGHWQIGSFTALATRAAEPNAAEVLRQAERPDHDAVAEPSGPVEADTGRSAFDFPRGARAGSCLHQIFEFLDFVRHDVAGLDAVVEQALRRHGFEAEWTPAIAAMVTRVLAAPLDGAGLRLADVSGEQRLNELEFHYPLARLEPEGLRRLLARHGDWPGPLREQIETLSFNPLAGYMKGYMDLVFEAGGRYYLVDYKSNWLGRTPDDYRPEQLAEAMARESYYLQYLIYTVALHRYLRLRLPNYDYAQHFGGAYYLFLRGMDPEKPGCGVFADKPAPELITALDGYLAGSEF